MSIPVLVVSSLLLAPPVTAPAVPRIKIWELSVSLSAGVAYRMDTSPARLHATGQELLGDAKRLAAEFSLPLGASPVLNGPQADTLEAMGYLVGTANHPAVQELEKRSGRPAAALFEMGLLTHLAMGSLKPGSENAKGIAEMFETAGKDSGVARASWMPFVDALRSGTTPTAAKEAMATMLQAVGKACGQ